MSLQKLIGLVVYLLVLCFTPHDDFSQLSSNRSLNLTLLSRMKAVYDSTTSMHQVRFSFLSMLPPLLTSMPFEQLISYVAVDSVLRTTSRMQICDWIDTQSGWNDTLKVLSKYYYTIVDEDPGRFAQYEVETRLKTSADSNLRIAKLSDTTRESSTLNGRYQTSFSSVRQTLEDKLVREWPDSSSRRAYHAMLTSDIVLKVRVLSIDSVSNKLTPTPMKSYAATCVVLDTVKGRVLPGSGNFVNHVSTASHEDQVLTVPGSIIRFEYLPILYPSYLESSSADGGDIVRDSAFTDSKGEFAMYSTQECIVFLSYVNPLVDDNYDYFNLSVNHFVNGGAMVIENGTVRDINKIWSTSGYLSIQDFNTKTSTIIDIIMNGK